MHIPYNCLTFEPHLYMTTVSLVFGSMLILDIPPYELKTLVQVLLTFDPSIIQLPLDING